MDVKAEADSGELIDVEMQRYVLPLLKAIPAAETLLTGTAETPERTAKGASRAYPERSLFYGARLVNSSLASGEDYDKMKKSIVISFIDGVIFSAGTMSAYRVFDAGETSAFYIDGQAVNPFLRVGKDRWEERPCRYDTTGVFMRLYPVCR